MYSQGAGSRVWRSDLFDRSQGKPEKQEPKRRRTKQSEGPRTGTEKTVVQTSEALVIDDKVQSDAKQPAARSTSATGLIAAFRPVEQLPASSAAATSLASSAGSNASDRQAADELLDLRSYVDALPLRAKVLQLELPAHGPEDECDKESAGTSVCLSTFALLLKCKLSHALPFVFNLCQLLYSLVLVSNSNFELAPFISTFCKCRLESRLAKHA